MDPDVMWDDVCGECGHTLSWHTGSTLVGKAPCVHGRGCPCPDFSRVATYENHHLENDAKFC